MRKSVFTFMVTMVMLGIASGADGDMEIQLGSADGTSVLAVTNSLSVDALRVTDDGLMMGRGVFGSGADLTIGGAGARLIWYPRKASFRAGQVDGDHWDDANIGNNSIALGRNTRASGGLSTAIGPATTASGSNSLALGRETTASGDGSTAIGRESTASSNYSTAFGYQANASGGGATAHGWQTTASGNYSTAMGNRTIASGYYSTAMGDTAEASGHRSVSIGYHTTAQHFSSVVIGKYNQLGATAHVGSGTVVGTDYLFAVGNGSDDANRSNAMTVLNNGNVLIAGDLTANGTLYPSDIRWKQEVEQLKDVLPKVAQLTGVTYYWNQENYPEKNFPDDKQIGLIAQDVETIFPELVHTDHHGYKSVAYAKLSAVLVEAVKELRTQNLALKKQNQVLEERLDRLESMITGQ